MWSELNGSDYLQKMYKNINMLFPLWLYLYFQLWS